MCPNKGARWRADRLVLKVGQTEHGSGFYSASVPSILDGAQDWELVQIPGPDSEVSAATRHRGGLHVHTQFMLIELTVLYEPRMEGLRMYKFAKYEGLVADLRDDGYTVRFFAVEVDARGLVSKSTYDALKQMGLKGATRNRALKNVN